MRNLLRNIPVFWKLLVISLTAVILIFFTWGLTVISMERTQISEDRKYVIYNDLADTLKMRSEITSHAGSIDAIYASALAYTLETDNTKLEELKADYDELKAAYIEVHQTWLNSAESDEELKAIITEQLSKADELFEVFEQDIISAKQADPNSTANSAVEKITDAYNAYETATSTTKAYADNKYNESLQVALDTNNQTTVILFIIIGAALTISVLVSFAISDSLRKHLEYVTQITDRISEGEFNIDIDPAMMSKDEVGRLAKSTDNILKRLNQYIDYINEIILELNMMANGNMVITLEQEYIGEFAPIKEALIHISESLKGTLLEINTASNQVNSSADEVANAAQTLASGSTQQAAAIEELTASISDISEKIKLTTGNADVAKKLSNESADEVEKGNTNMNDMLATMDHIQTSSNEIIKIIKVIDAIAFQTNILSLNASVEAARAGAAGKGFTVVADEVRNLAAKSAEAAKATAALINNSIQSISDGQKVSVQLAEVFKRIDDMSKRTSQLVNEISEATNEQSIAVEQIQVGLTQISGVIQETAATAENSSSASEELAAQSKAMRDLVSQFTLE
ncbi:MAG: HAMP domain-containing methyl-accepting chemotaxis protein [Lachnospiraceae bacterium]